MKLLGIRQAKDAKDREELEKRLRSKEINDEYTHRRELLNTLNDEWETSMKRQRDVWAQEKDAHAQWRASEDKEIKVLEKRRADALLPIQEREDAVTFGERNLRDAFQLFNSDKQEFEEQKEVFQKRLTEASDAKTQNDRVAQQLEMQSKGIESQRESVKRQAKEISVTMEQFTKATAEQNAKYATKDAEFLAREEGIRMGALRNQQRAEELDGIEVRLKGRERRAAEIFAKYKQYESQ